MAPHSSTLAWKIPWMEEPGRLQSMGSLRVRHDSVTSLSLFTFRHWRRKWQPTPVFLPGESETQIETLLGVRPGFVCLLACFSFCWGYSQLTDNIMIVSGEQQRDSPIHIHVSILLPTPLPSKLPYDTEQNSPCYSTSLMVIHFKCSSVHGKSLQCCPTVCDHVDCCPPGSTVHWILQARILE